MKMRSVIASAGAGAALAYFLDPDMGRTRRAKTTDRLGAMLRRGERRADRTVRRFGSRLYGLRKKAEFAGRPLEQVDDATLADRVRSTVLRSTNGHHLNISCEDAIVILRGECDDDNQIDRIERAVSRVPGVRGVQSFLHLPDTPAPNKVAAIHAGSV